LSTFELRASLGLADGPSEGKSENSEAKPLLLYPSTIKYGPYLSVHGDELGGMITQTSVKITI
jgi:hypothetical protein